MLRTLSNSFLLWKSPGTAFSLVLHAASVRKIDQNWIHSARNIICLPSDSKAAPVPVWVEFSCFALMSLIKSRLSIQLMVSVLICVCVCVLFSETVSPVSNPSARDSRMRYIHSTKTATPPTTNMKKQQDQCNKSRILNISLPGSGKPGSGSGLACPRDHVHAS